MKGVNIYVRLIKIILFLYNLIILALGAILAAAALGPPIIDGLLGRPVCCGSKPLNIRQCWNKLCWP